MYKKGWKEALSEKERLDKLAQKAKEKAAYRFFLKVGEKAKILFLDNEPFAVYEHSINVNGRWERVICTREFQDCPICAAFPNSRPQFTCYFTILDLRPFETKSGEKKQYSKKLFGAKGIMPQLLYDLSKEHGGLAGKVFEVTRYGEKSSNTGDHIRFVADAQNKLKKLPKDDTTPFNYKKIFAPLTEDELEELGIGQVSSSDVSIEFDDDSTETSFMDEDDLQKTNTQNDDEDEVKIDDDLPF